MATLRQQLWSYIKLLVRKWYILVIALVDLIGAVVLFLFPHLEIPQAIALVLGLFILFWAGFDVYREKLAELAKYRPDPDAVPRLAIQLVEGSEYEYSLLPGRAVESSMSHKQAREAGLQSIENSASRDMLPGSIADYKARVEEAEAELQQALAEDIMPPAAVTVHLRLTNVGPVSFDILNISVNYNDLFGSRDTAPPWSSWMAEILSAEGKSLTYPQRLDKQGILLCGAYARIEIYSLYNMAQFATRLADIGIDNPGLIETKVAVEVMTLSRQKRTFEHKMMLTTRPLKERYLARWRELDRQDLLQLANVGQSGAVNEQSAT